MNVLIQLAHPAHFYYYKNTIKNLNAGGHKVVIAITTKDILEKLLMPASFSAVVPCLKRPILPDLVILTPPEE